MPRRRYLIVQVDRVNDSLNFCELEVYAKPSKFKFIHVLLRIYYISIFTGFYYINIVNSCFYYSSCNFFIDMPVAAFYT